MSKFRSHWLALLGGVTLIALSMSTAFADKPDGSNHGLQVSASVHSLAGADEKTDTDTETEDETEDTEVESDESASSDHGECVAAVAQDPEAVGPPNDNHGGAVSEAARVTCWEGTDHANTNADTETGDSSDE